MLHIYSFSTPTTICEAKFVIHKFKFVPLEGIPTAAMDETFWCGLMEGDDPLVEQPLYIGT